MAIAWASAGAGAGTETNGAALNVSCPATVNAGDILIAQIMKLDITTTPDTPSGWELLYPTSGDAGLGTGTPVGRHWIYGKIADGSEDAAVIGFGTTGGTAGRAGRIHRFTGRTAGTIFELVRGFTDIPKEDDPGAPTVTTTYPGALAVASIVQDDDNAQAAFGAQTGGTWAEATGEYVSTTLGAQGLAMGLQTCTPTANPGTVTGGVMTTATDECSTIGFEIRPHPAPIVTSVGGGADVSSDDFNRTNNDDPGPPWEEAGGDWDILSNSLTLTNGSTEPGLCRYDEDQTTDHWAEIEIGAWVDGPVGVLVRMNDSGLGTCISLEHDGGVVKAIHAIDGGAAGTIATGGSYTPSAGDIIRAEVEGNTIRMYVNNVLELSFTSSTLAGNTRTGVHINETNSTTLINSFRTGPMPYVEGGGGSSEFREGEAVAIVGEGFNASQGDGEVEIWDDATGTTKVAQTINSWSDTGIEFVANLGSIAAGSRFLVVRDSDENDSRSVPITVHRAVMVTLAASANITAGGEDIASARLTGGTGSFTTGRVWDNENGVDGIDIGSNGHTEVAHSIQGTSAADGREIEFRYTNAGALFDTYTVTPSITFGEGGGEPAPTDKFFQFL